VESGLAEGFEELGERAEALARTLDDRQRLAKVRVRQAQGSWIIWVGPNGLATAIERAREAFDLAVPSALRTRSYARFLAGAASLALGRLRDAIREFDAGVELFSATPVDRETQSALPIRANLRAWQAEAYAALGEFEAALRSAAEDPQIADEIDHPQSRWLASAYLGDVLLGKGEIDAAARTYASGLAIAKDRELIQGVRVTSLGLAYCRFLVGRAAEGMNSIPEDRPPGGWGTLNFLRSVGRYGVLPASTYLAAGLLDEAEAEIAHGFALATAVKAQGYQVPLLRLRAEALAVRGSDHRDEAGRYWRQSLELATDLGMRPDLAHAHLGLGKLYRRTGKREEAQEHLTTATTMYREMGMTYWLEQAEAELGS